MEIILNCWDKYVLTKLKFAYRFHETMFLNYASKRIQHLSLKINTLKAHLRL